MRKLLFIGLWLTALAAEAGCVSARAAEIPGEAFPPAPKAAVMPAVRQDKCAHAPDAEGLKLLLAGLAKTQPCTAGNSLRLAAMGSGLLQWLAENPGWEKAVQPAVQALKQETGLGEQRKIERTLRLFRDAAERMEEEDLQAILADAGAELTGETPSKREFLSFAEAVSSAMMPEIFINCGKKVNILS